MPDIDDATPEQARPFDRILVLCVRVADLPEKAEDAAEALCDDCQQSVWWAETTVKLVREQGLPVHVRCNRCAGRLGFGGAPEPPTEAQRLEIARATGLSGDALDQVIANIRRSIFGGPGVAP